VIWAFFFRENLRREIRPAQYFEPSWWIIILPGINWRAKGQGLNFPERKQLEACETQNWSWRKITPKTIFSHYPTKTTCLGKKRNQIFLSGSSWIWWELMKISISPLWIKKFDGGSKKKTTDIFLDLKSWREEAVISCSFSDFEYHDDIRFEIEFRRRRVFLITLLRPNSLTAGFSTLEKAD